MFSRPAAEWQLFIDDAPIPPTRTETGDVWTWTPGFYAGTVRATLAHAGQETTVSFLLDVSPDPEKLGQSVYQAMVDEVRSFDADLILGEQAATTAIGTAGERENIGIVYMRMARYAEGLSAAIARIGREPHRSLTSARKHVPLHSVRMADVQTAIATIGSQAAAVFADDDDERKSGASPGQPLFDVPISIETFDTAANRTMAAILTHLAQYVGEISQRLEKQLTATGDDELQRMLSERWPRRQKILDGLVSFPVK